MTTHVAGAVAFVQRGSGQTEIVLSETGQGIGWEEEGIVPLWQGLLGCDLSGKCTDLSEAYWRDWEKRLARNQEDE